MSIDFKPTRFRNSASRLLVAAFFILLWLPIADSFLGLDKTQASNENRAPASFPHFKASLAGIHDYLNGLDAYYSDHFGFRKRLIRWERRWKRNWFKESASHNVIIGRDGWLFFDGDYMIEHYQGIKVFSLGELQALQDLLEKRRDWLARRGIKYLFMIPPDKQSIYPEFLPTWLVRTRATNKLDQFLTHMKAHSTVEVLDLRPALLEAKKTSATYLHTDTHWNFYGGFIGYQALLHSLAKQLPDLDAPLSLPAFDRISTVHPGGDLARMLGAEQSMKEKDYVELSPQPPLTALAIRKDETLLSQKWASETAPAYTEQPHQKYKILFFHDSFAEALKPFVGYSFKRAVYIWQPEWKTEFIEREKPDVVVDEMLERILYTLNTKKTSQKDGLP